MPKTRITLIHPMPPAASHQPPQPPPTQEVMQQSPLWDLVVAPISHTACCALKSGAHGVVVTKHGYNLTRCNVWGQKRRRTVSLTIETWALRFFIPELSPYSSLFLFHLKEFQSFPAHQISPSRFTQVTWDQQSLEIISLISSQL